MGVQALTRLYGAEGEPPPPAPESIGPYRLLRVLGQGGMGTVYLAEQTEPIQRQVAVKVTRHQRYSPRLHLRFELERRALARMSHPNIAQVYEAGELSDGRPYFVMEHVPGVQLDHYCDQHRLDVRERISLFLQVCAGIHHAHQKGVLHRDIKPANLLVSEPDEQPLVKVLDFGIAKELDAPVDAEQLTANAQPGTPAFFSPEVAGRDPDRTDDTIDIRSDVYSLGVLLYLLLVGKLPHEAANLSLLEYLQKVSADEPLAPSERLRRLSSDGQYQVSHCRDVTVHRLRRQLLGDLDRIVLKALARERRHRYGSAVELADDLQRFLAFEPVQARPPGGLYVLGKFGRRNRATVIATILLVLALVGGLIVRSHEARVARQAQEDAQEVNEFLLDLFADAKPPGSRADEVTLRDVLDRGTARIEDHFADQPAVRVRLSETMGEVYISLGSYETARLLLEEAEELRQKLSVAETPLEHAQRLVLLGNSYLALGRIEEAERATRQSVQVLEAHLPPDDLDLLRVRTTLANSLDYAGRTKEAVPLLEQALAASEGKPTSVPSILKFEILSGLGRAYLKQGRIEEAQALLEECVAAKQAIMGTDHLELIPDLDALARIEAGLGRVEEAEELHRRVLGIAERGLDANHPFVGIALNNLGVFLWQTGSLEEAQLHLERALSIASETLGSDHLELTSSLNNLAGLAAARQQPHDAIAYLERELEILDQNLPAGHERFRPTLEGLTVLLYQVGNESRAAQLEERLESVPLFSGQEQAPGEYAVQVPGEPES